MPKKSPKTVKRRAAYNSPPPPPPTNGLTPVDIHVKTVITAHYELREDWSIQVNTHAQPADEIKLAPPNLLFSDPDRDLWLYHGNSLDLLDKIAAKYPEGRFDAIFADPPYFASPPTPESP